MDVKERPESHSSPATSDHDVAVGTAERIDGADDKSQYGLYHRSISPRQIHMISLGGQIGAGLFISTGKNLRDGGPAGIFIAFAVVCSCVFAVLQTVSEMTIAFPVSGNFIEYADRFVDPAMAFAAGVSMWLGWTATVAAEATFFATIVNYWAKNAINDVVWCRSSLGWREKGVVSMLTKGQARHCISCRDASHLLIAQQILRVV